MRKLIPDGACACCGRAGSVWCSTVDVRPIDTGMPGLIWEANTSEPDLCDTCDYAQRRWDARQHQIRTPTAGYPYMERPPLTPPVRRDGDRDLGPDGWPR